MTRGGGGVVSNCAQARRDLRHRLGDDTTSLTSAARGPIPAYDGIFRLTSGGLNSIGTLAAKKGNSSARRGEEEERVKGGGAGNIDPLSITHTWILHLQISGRGDGDASTVTAAASSTTTTTHCKGTSCAHMYSPYISSAENGG